jgi:hypothetical protein
MRRAPGINAVDAPHAGRRAPALARVMGARRA